jgi:ribosomal protein L11 methyltransferase
MNTAPHDLWQISFSVPSAECAAAEVVLEDQLGDAVRAASRFEGNAPDLRQIQVIVGHPPDVEALTSALSKVLRKAPALRLEPVPETDWVTASLDRQLPVQAGRYFVYGSHVKDAPPTGSVALRVDAGMAFGTGSHETTRGSLLALDQIARGRNFRNTLDIGCGTGVLAMAMAKTFRAKTFRRPVLAGDIDPVAVAVARDNVRINGLARLVDVVCADGVRHRRLGARAPFDLVTANILAGPLVRLASQLRTRVVSGGVVILSGLLGEQEPMVLAAYRDQGFDLSRRLDLNGWRTLVLARR